MHVVVSALVSTVVYRNKHLGLDVQHSHHTVGANSTHYTSRNRTGTRADLQDALARCGKKRATDTIDFARRMDKCSLEARWEW